jgi:CRP/FNR family transcriptional regulator
LFELGIQQTWKRRQILFRAGDPPTAVFKVTAGIVAVSRSFEDGRRQILRFSFPGDICGYLQTAGKYAFEGEAVTEVRTCSFNRRRFDVFAAEHRDVADAIRAALEVALNEVGDQLAAVGQLTAEERLADFVCKLGIAYSRHAMQTRPLLLPMKRSHIAEYLGLRPETLSRAFSKLGKRGILDVDGDRVLIHDPARLVHLSEPD